MSSIFASYATGTAFSISLSTRMVRCLISARQGTPVTRGNYGAVGLETRGLLERRREGDAGYMPELVLTEPGKLVADLCIMAGLGEAATPTAQEAVLREIIDWCHLQPGNYPNWMDRARQAVGDFEGDPGQPPQPSETVAEAAKVTIEHEPCPKCASVNVEPYWWHRGQAWIIICQDCKHEEGREDAEYEAWQVWDEAALRALKGGEV